jgi:hypothetical protein
MSISLVPAGIRVAGQNLLSGFPPPCALRLRERMYFFATVPARLDLGLPRRTALQGFAGIRVHSRAKFSGLRSQIPGFFPSGEPRLGIDSNRESHPTKISFAKDMTRGERTCMDSR